MHENTSKEFSSTTIYRPAGYGAPYQNDYWGRSSEIRYPHLFRLLHWVLPASLLLLALSGLSLHATSRFGRHTFGGTLPWWLWSGHVHRFHLILAVVFSASLVTVIWVYFRDNARRRATHFLVLGGGLVMIATGLVLLYRFGTGDFWWSTRFAHAVVGLILLPAVLIAHVAEGLVWRRHRLAASFHPWQDPRWKALLWWLPALIVAGCLILGGLPMHPPWRDLVVRRIPRVSHASSAFTELPWDEVAPLHIPVAGGLGLGDGQTVVSLRAFHDGRQVFMLVEWDDPTEDRTYFPWEKTANGWHHQVTDRDEENLYHEDKVALVFPQKSHGGFSRFGCAACCHLGGGRTYGYKDVNSLFDVWCWKSTRTDPVEQIDDGYWWKADRAKENPGRFDDPHAEGGYQENSKPDRSHPLFLPEDPDDVSEGVLHADDAKRYAEFRAARFPVDTIVPGIVVEAFEGDRGHLHCQSRYTNGHWRIRLRRRLDTKSSYDVRFVPGRAYPFGVAVFDHTAKRHAYHFAAYRLVFEE